MAIEGVDYSDARPGGAALARAGKQFAGRYLYPGSGKGLQQAELDDLAAYGIEVFLIFEGGSGGMKNGRAQGVADAQLAQQELNGLKGIDHALPIYFCADWDASASEMSIIDSYLAGAASVIGSGRVGIYGSYAVITHCQSHHTAEWFFQTYAWSAGNLAPNIHLFQYLDDTTVAGSAVDLTRAMQDDFGGTVALTSSDITNIANAVWKQAIKDSAGDIHQAQTYLVWGWQESSIAAKPAPAPATTPVNITTADIVAALKDPTVLEAIAAAVAKKVPTKITGVVSV